MNAEKSNFSSYIYILFLDLFYAFWSFLVLNLHNTRQIKINNRCFFGELGLTARQDYFTHFEPSQS